jgi:hypothetical protein
VTTSAGSGVVLVVAEPDPARAEPGGALGGGARRDEIGVEGAGPAAGPVVGQAGPEAGATCQRLPSLPEPPLGPVDDLAALHAHERRHGFEIERQRDPQRGVVAGVEPLREGGIVLGVHRERHVAGGKVCEDGRDEHARRAVAFDDRHQPFGQVWGHAIAPIT